MLPSPENNVPSRNCAFILIQNKRPLSRATQARAMSTTAMTTAVLQVLAIVPSNGTERDIKTRPFPQAVTSPLAPAALWTFLPRIKTLSFKRFRRLSTTDAPDERPTNGGRRRATQRRLRRRSSKGHGDGAAAIWCGMSVKLIVHGLFGCMTQTESYAATMDLQRFSTTSRAKWDTIGVNLCCFAMGTNFFITRNGPCASFGLFSGYQRLRFTRREAQPQAFLMLYFISR